MKPIFQFILLLSLLSQSCSKTESIDDNICYGFDLRQCNGDPWNSNPGVLNSEQDLIAASIDYLRSQNITVFAMSIDNDFHTIVCEACIVCPVGPRYYVSIPSEQAELLEQQELLNLEVADCELVSK